MRIPENKNLKYDRLPWRGPVEGYERFNPENCILENFVRVNDKINLFFKNESQAIIRAINIEGGREMDSIENQLPELIGRNYKEILEMNF